CTGSGQHAALDRREEIPDDRTVFMDAAAETLDVCLSPCRQEFHQYDAATLIGGRQRHLGQLCQRLAFAGRRKPLVVRWCDKEETPFVRHWKTLSQIADRCG